ncbi:MAG: hypothetical protein ACETWG_07005 [Candidatus Neomarinimicrobiota bacterium]
MTSLVSPHTSLARVAGIFLRLYLVIFLVAGCMPRRPPVSVTEARSMETRIVQAEYDKVLKGSINVLQDLRYTIDVIDSNIGLVVASRSTEGEEAPLAKEPPRTAEVPTWQKVLGITIIVAIVAGIVWLLTRGGDDDGRDSDRDRGPTHVYHHNGDRDGPAVYQYKVTLNIESVGPNVTRVRVSGSGQRERGGQVEEAGPIEDPEFFQRFFASLDKALFLED